MDARRCHGTLGCQSQRIYLKPPGFGVMMPFIFGTESINCARREAMRECGEVAGSGSVRAWRSAHPLRAPERAAVTDVLPCWLASRRLLGDKTGAVQARNDSLSGRGQQEQRAEQRTPRRRLALGHHARGDAALLRSRHRTRGHEGGAGSNEREQKGNLRNKIRPGAQRSRGAHAELVRTRGAGRRGDWLTFMAK